MGTTFLSRTVLMSTLLCSLHTFAATDPLLGKWKTVDDRTGHSLADVVISKDPQGNYQAQVTEIRAIAGKDKLTTCQKCPGSFKDQPILGLTILSGLKKNPEHRDQYIEGRFLDPISGHLYVSEARLGQQNKYLQIRGQVAGSANVRHMTWIKVP